MPVSRRRRLLRTILFGPRRPYWLPSALCALLGCACILTIVVALGNQRPINWWVLGRLLAPATVAAWWEVHRHWVGDYVRDLMLHGTRGVCPRCGYSLEGLTTTVCPECGTDAIAYLKAARRVADED